MIINKNFSSMHHRLKQYEKSIIRKNKSINYLRDSLATCTKTAEELTIQLNDCDFEYIEACHKEIAELNDKLKVYKNIVSEHIEQRR